jgi:hypothetical protein
MLVRFCGQNLYRIQELQSELLVGGNPALIYVLTTVSRRRGKLCGQDWPCSRPGEDRRRKADDQCGEGK